MFDKSFQRPRNFFELDAQSRWDIDKELGILDWIGGGLSKEDKKSFRLIIKQKRKVKNNSFMLRESEYGYAVMNKELTASSLEDIDLETCKRYCRNGKVIARRVPYVCGFKICVTWFKDWYKPICLKGSEKNIFWLHWSISKVYSHKTGAIVYTSKQ